LSADALVSLLKHEIDRAEALGFERSTIWLSRGDTDTICDAFEARAACNRQMAHVASERDRLLEAADRAVSGDLKPLANLVREIRSGVRWEGRT
jgi:hypothetical protein